MFAIYKTNRFGEKNHRTYLQKENENLRQRFLY